MTLTDLVTMLPLVVMGAAVLIVMLAVAFYRQHTLVAVLTFLGLVLAFGALFFSAGRGGQVTSLLIVDPYARFFMGLILAAAAAVVLLAHDYFARHAGAMEEFYVLLLLATLGSLVLVASNHFASFFLGLEILSVSLYGMIAYLRDERRSIEAAVKYLVLAAASAAFLLFGMALIYAETGKMQFDLLAKAVTAGGQAQGGTLHVSVLLLTGVAMTIVGIGFKLAVVPFHMWTPDVYEGAPAPVTAFVATVSKGAMFALLLRYAGRLDFAHNAALMAVFAAIAVASMFVGNLLALRQNNVKRLLAYSSISHLGYLLVAFLAGGDLASIAVAFYLSAYFVTTLGAFGIVTLLSDGTRDADAMEDYRGLYYRRPWLAGVFAATLLSLAGIPLTAGFVGKFYILAAGIGSAQWALAIILAVNSAIGLYYYLRVTVAMYMRLAGEGMAEGEGLAHAPAEALQPAAGSLAVPLSLAGSGVLAVLTLLLVWLGVYPAPLLALIRSAVAGIM